MVYLSFTALQPAHDLAKTDASPAAQDLSTRFAADWHQGLFSIGARRASLAQIDAARFWAGVAARYLTAVCHLPESQTIPEPATRDELSAWVENAIRAVALGRENWGSSPECGC